MKRFKNFILLSVCISLICSCKKFSEPPMAEFVEFQSNGIVKDKDYVLHPIQLNDSDVHPFLAKVTLVIRYSQNSIVRSLPLEIEYLPNYQDSLHQDTITIPLFDEDDMKIGSGSFPVYENHVTLTKQIWVDSNFFLSLKTHEHNTHGILSAGVIIHRQKN